MVLEKSKEMIFEACRIWQKSNIAKGIATYYANFEEFSKRHIQDEIDDYKKAIDSLKQRSETLKKEIKKDKEKKAVLDEVKNHLETALADLKTKKKELETLPQRIKQIKADFQDQMKDLSRMIDEIAKLKGQELKSDKIGAILQKMKELVSKFNEINEIASLDEIIKDAGIEFKLENAGGEKRVKDYKKLAILLEESIGAQSFDLSENEKIGTKKAEFLKNACTEFAQAAAASKEENFDVNYYAGLLALAQGSLIISFGIQKMENFEYSLATQYFLQARELFVSIVSVLDLPIVSERIAVARAMASDAFNTIYMLNSYDSWKTIDGTTEDPELKEISGISIKNIEEWVTKQYGFPSDEKISEILNTMIWPRPMMPPELESFVPKKVVKPPKAKVAKKKGAEQKAKKTAKKQPKSKSSKKKTATASPELDADVEVSVKPSKIIASDKGTSKKPVGRSPPIEDKAPVKKTVKTQQTKAKTKAKETTQNQSRAKKKAGKSSSGDDG